MAQRITFVLDDEIYKKLRIKQASLIKTKSKSISFSRVINDELRNKIK